jgi:hypothetical protein
MEKPLTDQPAVVTIKQQPKANSLMMAVSYRSWCTVLYLRVRSKVVTRTDILYHHGGGQLSFGGVHIHVEACRGFDSESMDFGMTWQMTPSTRKRRSSPFTNPKQSCGRHNKQGIEQRE